MSGVTDAGLLQEEAASFDRQIEERVSHGFVPDLRRLRQVEWFYNNLWRDPEFVRIQLLPKVEFVVKIATQRGGKVVELGCGPGYLTLELARHGLDVLGVDLSPKCIEIARRYGAENPFVETFGSLAYECADFAQFPLGDGAFDTVVFFASLHHVPDIETLLGRVQRGLRSGGSLVICEPIRENFTRASAEFAAVLRAVLPTWRPYEEKLAHLTTPEAWGRYVDEIYSEYTYRNEHEQSPLDNATASADRIIGAVKRFFQIEVLTYEDAFIDRIIGGLRGPSVHVLARFLKSLDETLVARGVLPATSIRLHATRR